MNDALVARAEDVSRSMLFCSPGEVSMEGYRLQQLAYLVIPVTAGVEFFLTAKAERKKEGKESARAVTMDAFGYLFIALIPALFLFTIFSLEYKKFPQLVQVLHRLDRYGVMFFFLGAWWQIFMITALRARRVANQGGKCFLQVWCPYLLFGAFISALVLWVAPWNLMWVSFFWFVASCGVCGLINVSPSKLAKIFMILTVLVLIGENILFIILDAIV